MHACLQIWPWQQPLSSVLGDMDTPRLFMVLCQSFPQREQFLRTCMSDHGRLAHLAIFLHLVNRWAKGEKPLVEVWDMPPP